jgi:hypothetical protein
MWPASGRPRREGGAVRPEPDHLRRVVEAQTLPWYDLRRTELANKPLMREQGFGEALNG